MWWLRGAVCGWSLMGTSGPRVSGHASAVVGEHLYVFGGLLGGSLTSDELWRYDGNQWNAIQNKGPTWPTRRMHAAMASAEGSLYIFGGWDPYAANEKIKRDVWEYNTHTKRWRELTSMPHTASQHAACVVEDRVVLHTCRGTLVLVDGRVQEQRTRGHGPYGRLSCACSPLGRHMFVFGGTNCTRQVTNEAHLLDTKTWTWTRLENVGDVPPARAGACAAELGDKSCLVFGGASICPDDTSGVHPRSRNDTYVVTVTDGHAKWIRVEYVPGLHAGRPPFRLGERGGLRSAAARWTRPGTKDGVRRHARYSPRGGPFSVSFGSSR